MGYQKSARKCVCIVAICLLLIGCIPIKDNLSDQTQKLSENPTSTDTSTPAEPTPSPTSCTGWTCEIDGAVYLGSVEVGNALEGAQVHLSQISWCSPTAGEQETQSDPNGAFVFEVYLHDTDSFVFQVDVEDYQPVKVKMGGFDCLYCNCPPIEIVLKAEQ